MSKAPRPNALTLMRQRANASRNPSKRENAAWNHFYSLASPKEAAPVIVPPPRAARKPSDQATEHQEQCAVISWWMTACKLYKLPPIVLMSIPNAQILMGSARHPERVMQYLRAEGFRVGAPDLFLAAMCATGPDKYEVHHGLFIEMKRAKGGIQSIEQVNFALTLRQQGYRYELCHGADAAIACIKQYLA